MEYKTLKEFCTITKGKTGIMKAIPGKFPLVVTSEERKTHNEFQFEANAVIIPLVSGTGHGHASIKRIHYQEGKFALGTILCAIIPKNEKELNAQFLYHYLSLVKEKELVGRMKGMANVTLPIKEIEKVPIPILTIGEQLKFVEFYTSLKSDCNAINIEFFHQLSLISQLRQTFLREAMQGKLVSNETSDGKTGADLLAEIKTEKEKLIQEKKIKKGKPLPPISEDEIPFDNPENWVWCRLGEISEITRGKSPVYNENGKPFMLNQKCVRWFTIDVQFAKFVDFKWFASLDDKYLLKQNDILVNSTGEGTIGRSGIIGIDSEGYSFDSHTLKVSSFITQSFICYFINSQFGQQQIEDLKGAKSTKQTELGSSNLNIFKFPLPPLEIQNRIVSTLEELMTYCDDLETAVKESQKYNAQLLQQILREALEVKEIAGEEVLSLVAEEKPVYSISDHAPKTCNTGDMAILAGYIITKLSTKNPKDFGRVKLQKMLHLVEYHCQLSTELKYQKKVAGPYSSDLEYLIEPKLKSFRFFEIKKEKFGNNDKVTYTPLQASKEIPTLFNREFKDQSENINHLLNKFRSKDWEFCELISTMYAVWNNRLIRKELFTDDILKQDFLAWDKEKIKFIDKLDYAIAWIRKEKIEPVGFGEYIDKK